MKAEMKAPTGWKWFLVEYEHDGSKWSLDILAKDERDAGRRVENLFSAKLLGEHIATVPAYPCAGILVRLVVAVRNFFWK